MKRLIYTAVFGNYDRVYPPIGRDAGVDYILVTDQADLVVPGWTTMAVDGSAFPGPKAANLHYRALMHRTASGYDTSLYIDGNQRILREMTELFERFERSGADIGAFVHPRRSTVAEEARAVIAASKVADASRVTKEVETYFADGFPDDGLLVEAGRLLKNHRAAGLDRAMELWESLFRAHQTRDQLSFPYVVWKTGVTFIPLDGLAGPRNHFFGRYPHVGMAGVNPLHVHIVARSHDSLRFRILLALWRGITQSSRRLRRKYRRFRERPLRRSGR